MKKLMIAAAAAAMVGGAFADPCSPEEPSTDCAQVYKVKMSLKTTKGIIGTEAGFTGTICAPEEYSACTVIRVKDSTKFEGWIYECVCGCETIKSGSVVAWDSKRKAQLEGAAFDWAILNVIGKKQGDAEAMWAFTGTAAYDETRQQAYSLTGAGFGKYSAKKGLFTSFSGNVAGSASGSYDLSIKKITEVTCVCEPSQVWFCTDLSTLETADTIAYGTWSVKYDSSASKKFLANGYLKVPSYVSYAE